MTSSDTKSYLVYVFDKLLVILSLGLTFFKLPSFCISLYRYCISGRTTRSLPPKAPIQPQKNAPITPLFQSFKMCPILAKHRVLWDLVQYHAKKALKYCKKIKIDILGFRFQGLDLRDHDIPLIVHATKSEASRLSHILCIKGGFVRFEPFISASLVNRMTASAELPHQNNVFPAVLLVFSVPANRIHATSPTDYHSYYAEWGGSQHLKQQCLTEYIEIRDEAHAKYRERIFSGQSHRTYPLDPLHMEKEGQATGDTFMTPGHLLAKTDRYNEILIGKGLDNSADEIEFLGPAVDEGTLQEFFDKTYPQLSEEEQGKVKSSLSVLEKHGPLLLLNIGNKKQFRKARFKGEVLHIGPLPQKKRRKFRAKL